MVTSRTMRCRLKKAGLIRMVEILGFKFPLSEKSNICLHEVIANSQMEHPNFSIELNNVQADMIFKEYNEQVMEYASNMKEEVLFFLKYLGVDETAFETENPDPEFEKKLERALTKFFVFNSFKNVKL